ATAGQTLTGTVAAPAHGAGTDTYLRLFDATGNELRHVHSGSSSNTLTFQVATGGTYYLGVSAFPNVAYSPTIYFSHYVSGKAGAYYLSITKTTHLDKPIFVIGLDQQVYAQRFDGNGNSLGNYSLTAPGAVLSLVAGSTGGAAQLFVIGLDHR